VASSSNGATAVPTGHLLGAVSNAYGAAQNPTSLNATAIANQGSSQPHNNMQPYLTLSFCIALQGIFPSQN
jgi:microcystin-dependent protein